MLIQQTDPKAHNLFQQLLFYTSNVHCNLNELIADKNKNQPMMIQVKSCYFT